MLSIRVHLHDIPYGDCFTPEHMVVLTKNKSSSSSLPDTKTTLKAQVYLGIPFSKGCMFKSRIVAGTKQSVTESYQLLFRLMADFIKDGGTISSSNTTTHANVAVESTTNQGNQNGGGPKVGSSRSLGGSPPKTASSGRRLSKRKLMRMASVLDDANVALEEIFENQRVHIFGKWEPNHLWPTDRPRFSNRQGDVELSFDGTRLPSGWIWTSDWKIDMKYTDVDDEGWSYATDFPRFKAHLAKGKSNPKRGGMSVRRRRWIRTMCLIPPAALQEES